MTCTRGLTERSACWVCAREAPLEGSGREELPGGGREMRCFVYRKVFFVYRDDFKAYAAMMPEQQLLLPPRKPQAALLLKCKPMLWFEQKPMMTSPKRPRRVQDAATRRCSCPCRCSFETLALRNRVSMVRAVPERVAPCRTARTSRVRDLLILLCTYFTAVNPHQMVKHNYIHIALKYVVCDITLVISLCSFLKCTHCITYSQSNIFTVTWYI